MIECQQPQAHPSRCGCEQETSAGREVHASESGFPYAVRAASPASHRISPAIIASDPRLMKAERSAERTLRNMGYTDNGGELWKPPIGEKPNFNLIDALRQQLADVSNERDGLRAASHWVSIKDRMPEHDQECLIRIPVLQYFEIEGAKYLGDGQWVGAFCSSRGKGKCYKVTHWMPLPNPPTEQQVQS